MSGALELSDNLMDLLRARAKETPEAPAFTFLDKGEEPTESLGFAALDSRARAIAAALQAADAEGQRVLLFYPTGVEFLAAFLGCLYAGAVAVPTSPPLPGHPPTRLLSVHADSRPVIALCNASVREFLEAIVGASPFYTPCLATDEIDGHLGRAWSPPAVDGNTLALLQYTSGSTSTPKGVMVSHGNLMTNTRVIQTAFEQPPGAVIVSWLPLFHDMGLIGTALDALTLGSHCVLMDPQSFIMKPVRWLRAISDYHAHTSGGPDFGYQLCTRKIKDSQLEGIDLSGWKVAFNGSERVRPQTVQDFARRFASVGVNPHTLYPCYGLAESTLFATGGDQSAAPLVGSMDAEALEASLGKPAGDDTGRHVELVSSGRPWCDHQLLIVNPETAHPLADGQVGEIWFAGASVAKGYFNRPAETLETFDAHTDSGEGPYLRTGDLGFVQEEELFITGRLKDLIIVAGHNHYPEDIEQTIEACHPAIRPGGVAAFSLEEDGVERLGVVAELSPKAMRTPSGDLPPEMETQAAIVSAATEAIAARHSLKLGEILLVPSGSVPKTTSGKVQRRRCKEAYMGGRIDTLGSQP